MLELFDLRDMRYGLRNAAGSNPAKTVFFPDCAAYFKTSFISLPSDSNKQ